MRLFWSVAIGAAAGGVSRFYLNALIQQRAGADFPLGTFVINISGSLLLGFLLRYALQSGGVSEELRLLLTTGFCGGYTTFSTFSYDTLVLVQDREYGRAGLYVAGSVLLSVVAAFVGFAAANYLITVRAEG
ncbi:MAG TPA: fluoride efflux transporter CrcB [Gemmatimonadaceae bacterium]|nr:fluoride efflux transporter CrcB [Gemmatimonadaceae bacterium]